jgi:hypothetical protein
MATRDAAHRSNQPRSARTNVADGVYVADASITPTIPSRLAPAGRLPESIRPLSIPKPWASAIRRFAASRERAASCRIAQAPAALTAELVG